MKGVDVPAGRVRVPVEQGCDQHLCLQPDFMHALYEGCASALVVAGRGAGGSTEQASSWQDLLHLGSGHIDL